MSDFDFGIDHGGSSVDHGSGGSWKATSPRARRLVLAFVLVVLICIVAIGAFVVSAIMSMGATG